MRISRGKIKSHIDKYIIEYMEDYNLPYKEAMRKAQWRLVRELLEGTKGKVNPLKAMMYAINLIKKAGYKPVIMQDIKKQMRKRRKKVG